MGIGKNNTDPPSLLASNTYRFNRYFKWEILDVKITRGLKNHKVKKSWSKKYAQILD